MRRRIVNGLRQRTTFESMRQPPGHAGISESLGSGQGPPAAPGLAGLAGQASTGERFLSAALTVCITEALLGAGDPVTAEGTQLPHTIGRMADWVRPSLSVRSGSRRQVMARIR
jgi:hypothetical protein